MRRRAVAACVLGAALALAGFAHSAFAQPAWPARTVRLVAPFPPGNSSDVIARAIADKLAQRLGQPVIVENRAGASGVIGTEAVARAAPDGYTIALASLSPITIVPAVSKRVPYDPVKDLQPITLLSEATMVLVATPGFPASDLRSLVALVKANPGRYSYASIGAGTISQMVMESLKAAAGLDIVEIGYKGSAQALTDVLSGQVHLMFDGAGSAVPQYRGGKVKGIAVAARKRSQLVPELPTVMEAGLPGLERFSVFGWVGALAPAGTPQPIVQRLHRELSAIMQEEDVRKRVNAVGLEVTDLLGPEAFAAFVREDLARWTAVAKAAKIEVQ
jgi:tripartite-type tricarboxylate transporter receptor subunit TctC